MAVKKKSAAKKKVAPKKKVVAKKKVAAKKAAPARTPAPRAIKEAYTKTQLLAAIAEDTGLSKKDVSAVMDSLKKVIHGHIRKNGAGQFTLPGLLKIKTKVKPAVRARKGINPFTGEETVFKARPKSIQVKVLALKAMKDMAN